MNLATKTPRLTTYYLHLKTLRPPHNVFIRLLNILTKPRNVADKPRNKNL